MRIREIEIKNFRSLRHVKLENLGDLVILIGRNGSGKSNVLEALELFFADLNLMADVEKQATPELWFDKRTNRPIDMRIVIELEARKGFEDDLSRIFTKEVMAQLKMAAAPAGRRLTIGRQLTGKLWKTTELNLEHAFRLDQGKVLIKTPIAAPSTAAETASQNPAKGSEERTLEPEAAQTLLKTITNEFKNEFKMIRGPRESTERPTAPTRAAILDAESKAFYTALALEKDRSKEEKWNEYADEFERFSRRRLQVRGTDVEFRQGDLALSLELSGSGDQAILILMRQFQQEAWFYGIEEPETRLHHDYIRKLFEYLRRLSQDWQLLVATHSPVFVDRAFLNNTWLTRLEGKATKVSQLEKGDLRDVLFELGIRPSDFFFANHVLFVEGRSEEVFVPLLAAKAGLDFTNVKVIPLRGKSRTNYHLRVWIEAAKDAGIPAYVLVDKNGAKEVEDLINDRKIDRDNCMVLDKDSLHQNAECDIEDLYPKNLLKEALQNLYPKASFEKALLDDNGSPCAGKIASVLRKESWKPKLAEYVGTRLTTDHVEGEFREVIRFFRRIPETRANLFS